MIKTMFAFGPPPTIEDYRSRLADGAITRRDGAARAETGRPLVSIITVVRNAAETLPRTIETVRAQTYAPIEYVVVDGGSTDGTLDVIRANEDVISVWLSERDQGIYDAFNKGAALSTGRYIQFLNADDWMSPDQVERAVAALQANAADFAFGDIWLHGWQGQDVFVPGDPAYGESIRKLMPRLAQTTAYCSRHMFEKIGLFRTGFRIASDYDWFLRAHLSGLRGVHDGSIVGHMLAGGLSTTAQRTAIFEGFLISLRNGYPWLPCVAYWSQRWLFVNELPPWWRNAIRRANPRTLATALHARLPRGRVRSGGPGSTPGLATSEAISDPEIRSYSLRNPGAETPSPTATLVGRAGRATSTSTGGLTSRMRRLMTPNKELAELRHQHLLALTKLRIREGDARELEAMYRHFVFQDLPVRDGRADDLANLIGTTVGEGLYIVHHLLRSLKNPGDICEFGVAQGATSTLLAREIMDTDRKLWLFDSFEGLPKPHEKDKLIHDIFNLGSMESYQGQMKCQADEVLGRLSEIRFPKERIRLMPGWVEELLRRPDVPVNVAFAYIDFDFYNPIKETLKFLDGRMAQDSRIIVDDYDFFSSGAKTAVDEFVAENPGRYRLELPIPAAGHFCILIKVC